MRKYKKHKTANEKINAIFVSIILFLIILVEIEYFLRILGAIKT